MKVLIINTDCGVGSTGRICADIAMELERRGAEVKIAFGRDYLSDIKDKYGIQIGSKWNVICHGIKTRCLDAEGFGSINATKCFIEWVKQYDPDVIHLHNLHGYYVNVDILFKYLKICGKKIVWTLHDCWSFTGHCPYFSAVKCEKWKTGCYHCSRKKEYPKSLFFERSKYNYKRKKQVFTNVTGMRLTTPSKWLADMVSESFLKEYPVEIVNNGIDLELFRTVESNFRINNKIQGKKMVLGVANVWDERKRLDLFVQLSRKLPENYVIVLVGLSSSQLKKMPSNIMGFGRTKSISDLIEIYASADVFVNPGKEETFGMTTLEALACGIPVIVSNETAIPEVGDGSCQFVSTNDDMYEHLIRKVCEDKVFDSSACRKRAESFGKEKMINAFIKLYE